MIKPDPIKPKADAVSPEYLLIKAKEALVDKETLALFCVLYVTGARISEVLRLKRKSVVFNNISGQKVIVFHCPNLKNRKDRMKIIPVIRAGIDVEYYDIICDWIKDIDMQYPLFISYSERGEDIEDPYHSSRTRVGQKLAKIEIETTATIGQEFINPYIFRLHPHFLRHCRSSHWRMYWKYSETITARLLGHTSTAMLFTYDRVTEYEIVKAAMEGLK